MNRVSLFKEYRLIERSESEVNGAWKGAHILLFFLAFVFGSFCTFCFHLLMYLFDDKCVLFPKLQSLAAVRQDVIYDFIPADQGDTDKLPVDFLSSQWVEKSTCYLPTYVPLVSGIFGLVWTTMFLMCSTGSRTQTGLQRPWRVLPPVFIFSLAMGGLSIYSSVKTDYGLHELCLKLAEITGSPTCTYTVNVATLAYERRIRGVYQAIRLTTMTAWLHTMCWILSAVLALCRVVLAVDFQLVRVNVELIGDTDKMMERHEKQIRTISPDLWYTNDNTSITSMPVSLNEGNKVRFLDAETLTASDEFISGLYDNEDIYVSELTEDESSRALVPVESHKLARIAASEKLPQSHRFIVKILYDLILNIDLPESLQSSSTSIKSSTSLISPVVRQYGEEKMDLLTYSDYIGLSYDDLKEYLLKTDNVQEITTSKEKFGAPEYDYGPSTSKGPTLQYESTLNITEEMKKILDSKKKLRINEGTNTESPRDPLKQVKKSNLKHVSIQTDDKQENPPSPIPEPKAEDEATEISQDIEKETQTPKDKEKQD